MKTWFNLEGNSDNQGFVESEDSKDDQSLLEECKVASSSINRQNVSVDVNFADISERRVTVKTNLSLIVK